ncbi:MAG: SurA N-terminal domain-containing protein [Deltaproteobacteria bacterium]|nr:SurA N-terminal domain-containing protein [Deltaproteobacteria bacterium]MBI4796877.1 SurA N-terminal domain-containing protein [Deltaproteobacteria bacterium]
MKRLVMRILVCLAACLAPLLLALPGHAEIVDRIVAVVNDEIITMSELEQMSRMIQSQAGANPKSREGQAIKREMLEALIDRKLAKAEAKRRGIIISDKEVDLAVEDFKKKNRLPDDAALNQALAKAGLTVKELRQQIADQIQQERLVFIALGAKKAEVPEAEVRRYYDANVREGGGGNQVHLQIINIPFPPGATAGQKEEVQKRAETVLKDLRLGGSLAEVQRKHSLTSQDLGFINQADLNPQLGELINKLRPGEVAPIQSPEGFQLVVLVGKRSGKPHSFEEVAPEIRRMLSSQAMQKQFLEWVKTLREKAHIKIML